MSQYSISIIVLTYRKFDNLKRNMESIRTQTFDDYEVIISDDGSENFDLQLVRNCCNGINNVSIVHNEKNVGTVRNLNKAVDASRGKYIVPLSQDDAFFDENTLQDIFDFFETRKCDIFTAMSIGERSRTIKPLEYERVLLRESDVKKAWIRCAFANYISGACTYYRSDYLKSKGGFDDDMILLEDYPMVMSQFNNGYVIPIMEKPTIVYGEDGVAGASTQPSQLLVNDSVHTYEKYIISHANIMNSAFNKRIIRWRKHRWENYSSLRKYSLKYLDVLAWCFETRIRSRIINVDCGKIRFESMMKQEEKAMNKAK